MRFGLEKFLSWNKEGKAEGWSKKSIEPPDQPEGGRNLEKYELALGFNRKDFEDKTILDLGSGPEAKFAKGLEMNRIKSKVIELSPDFFYKKYRKRVKKSYPEVKAVSGLGQQLPFKDESFDRIVCFQVFQHLLNESDQFNMIAEIARVLKKGGKAYVGPLTDPEYRIFEENRNQIKELEKYNSKVTEEKISEEYGMRRVDLDDSHHTWRPYLRLIIEKLT